MGLDMYLKAMPKIEGYSFDKLIELDNLICEFDSLESMQKVIPSQVLEKVTKVGEYITWYSISEKVAYWRKANQIHQWFVENVQSGEDECNPYEVQKEHIEDLLHSISTVLKARGTPEEQSVAETYLPTQAGFFFGSTDYDNWYYQDLKETKTVLSSLLEVFDFKNNYLFYQSSW